MKIHKEGFKIIGYVFISLLVVNMFIYFFTGFTGVFYGIGILSVSVFIIILQFFRKPNRMVHISEDAVVSPADGKVVVIETVKDSEYMKDERIQVSIFMSVWNVHINWFPVSGIVKYFKYHKGKYLLARNPKSSFDNERTTIVIENNQHKKILFRQIAGIMARRIVCNVIEGKTVQQSSECGFIKFGSRLDILLPLDAVLNVKLGDKVKGSRSVIAYI